MQCSGHTRLPRTGVTASTRQADAGFRYALTLKPTLMMAQLPYPGKWHVEINRVALCPEIRCI